ncbi:angiomotin [Procambarus clarkii]|uniref:angiomotin n=1 Tax=Procambarus clarkii TaxID=6728 RepID=UPI00374356F9
MTMKGVFVCVAALVYAAAAMPPPGAASGVPPPPHTAATPSPAAAPVAAPFSMFSAFVPTAKEIADLQALNTTPAPGILPVAAIAGLPAAAIGRTSRHRPGRTHSCRRPSRTPWRHRPSRTPWRYRRTTPRPYHASCSCQVGGKISGSGCCLLSHCASTCLKSSGII